MMTVTAADAVGARTTEAASETVGVVCAVTAATTADYAANNRALLQTGGPRLDTYFALEMCAKRWDCVSRGPEMSNPENEVIFRCIHCCRCTAKLS